MEKIDREIDEVKKLLEELDYRTKIGREADRLICEGEFQKAIELMDSLKNCGDSQEESGEEQEKSQMKPDSVMEIEEKRFDLIAKKEQQIKSIILEENITFGMALRIICRIETELLQAGDTFLRATELKNVPPYSSF